MNAGRLSRQLREGSGGHLDERRAIACASLVAMGCLGLVSLYQMGVIKHLPEPRLPGLDAEKANSSEDAYSRLDTGDAILGLRSYAITMGLAAMGGKRRGREKPWVPLGLAAKTAFDAIAASRIAYKQFSKHGAASGWFLLAAAASFASAALAIPEARTAVRNLARRS